MSLTNFNINPYIKPYVGGISHEYADVLGHKIQDYDIAVEHEDALGYQSDILNNMVLPHDRQYTGQIVDDVRKSIADRAAKGDYENLGRAVKRSARDFSAKSQPLLARKAQYDQYLKDMNEQLSKGEIGRDTYQKSIAITNAGIKGYNPYDPETHSFGTFKPTKDVSIADKLNKYFGDTFKGDKAQYDIINPITGLRERVSKESNEEPVKVGSNFLYYDDNTNSYNTKGEGRKISQIELAGRQYLQGDKESQNYFDTQRAIGNHDRILSEVQGALQGEVQKLGYNINVEEKNPLEASWLKWWSNKTDESKPFESTSEVPSENVHVNPKFTEYSFSPTGKLAKNTEYYQANSDGTYNKFYDKNGRQLTLNEKNHYDLMGRSGIAGNYASPSEKEKYGYTTAKVNQNEQKEVERKHNEEFDQLKAHTWLADHGYSHLDEQAQRNILNVPEVQAQLNNPVFSKSVLERYNQAITNFKTVENQLWTKRSFAKIKEIGDMNVPIGEDGNSVLAKNLQGATIDVLSNDKNLNINTEGVKDINTLLDKVQDKGYKFIAATDNGLMKINPKNNTPASSVTLEFKDQEGKVKYVNVAVNIGDAQKKPLLGIMQRVGQAYLSGNGGFVGIPGLGKAGFKVINAPTQVIQPGMPSFAGMVQEIDSNGNPSGKPVPIHDWLDQYIEAPAVKSEANSYLINK